MGRLISSTEVTGKIIKLGGSTIPVGYLPCDGSTVSTTTYASLFATISTTYNVGGEPGGTFRLPDFRGRVPMGDGAGSGLTVRTLGQRFGEENHQLTAAESGLPAHNHPYTDPGHTHLVPTTNATPGEGGGANAVDYIPAIAGASAVTNITINNNVAANAASAHNVIQPTLVVKYAIRY